MSIQWQKDTPSCPIQQFYIPLYVNHVSNLYHCHKYKSKARAEL